MTYSATMEELGIALANLVEDHAEWSRATFGDDSKRGPVGPLKHLAKEAIEAKVAVDSPEEFKAEMADCLLLILDASRRGGVKIMQLIEAGQDKMRINRGREWDKASTTEAVEHIRREQK